ncbi:MAG: redoxin domain-containing protein [Flavobacteriia bacterium]|nr:redoxin domain-containing protein [Flavobacteriia bacterium]
MKIQNALKITTAAALIGLGVYNNYTASNAPATPEEEAKVIQVGEVVPDLEGRTPSGEIIKLSDLRGKVVFIDFWASWCRPCVNDMPHVVTAYNEYKDDSFQGGEGFTVFSVSLDQRKSAWTNAIARLNQTWPNHISDLRGWGSAHAELYNVNSIPSAFLIDGEGRLIYGNVRGSQLPSLLAGLTK